jgi:hypothetical protein
VGLFLAADIFSETVMLIECGFGSELRISDEAAKNDADF